MGKKRKRPIRDADQTRPLKSTKNTQKSSATCNPEPTASPTHPVLALYYPRVPPRVSPRSSPNDFQVPTPQGRVLGSSAISSKPKQQQRQKRRQQHQQQLQRKSVGSAHETSENGDDAQKVRIREVAAILDTTLVGVLKPLDPTETHARQRDFAEFTQTQFRSSTLRCTDVGATSSLGEIVDFAILTLFKQQQRWSYGRHSHLLCHGFQRASANQEHAAFSGIPGIVPKYPNKHVSMLKSFPWTDVLELLGANCEEIMLHLLIDCGLFISLDSKNGSLYQVSGTQLIELNPLQQMPASGKDVKPDSIVSGNAIAIQKMICSPRNIAFVRNRMFYARPEINAKGEPKLGLQHIHVLNRYPDCRNLDHTVHIMKYIFPRQFGLHNVFTSAVDPKATAQSLQNYTLREEEIKAKAQLQKAAVNKLPKRLRGEVFVLIQKLQKRHQRCSYVELLRHYCPFKKLPANEQHELTQFATPVASVSAFCQAVLQKLVPNDIFGVDEDGINNRRIVLQQVNLFLRQRKFESITLHDVAQGLKITCIKWLIHPQQKSTDKLSLSDKNKRLEILLEFIYYIFDSLVIPLIRTNFHVTESNVHRNRLFYFRQDIWNKLIEPPITQLKATAFSEVKKEFVSKALGCSTIRMLPKGVGARPIVNMRKRTIAKSKWSGKSELGPSVNMRLAPMFQALNCEKDADSGLLGSAMVSLSEMNGRLKSFQNTLCQKGWKGEELFFVKLDVQACYDTIPQERLLQLVEDVISEDQYRVSKWARVGVRDDQSKPTRKFISKTSAATDFKSPYDFIMEQGPVGKKSNSVFVDTGYQKQHRADDLMALLEQHVRNNLVKIGKKYFRQTNGIPQGSIVSTILCNIFYGEHERQELDFLHCDEALLLRFVDDYLLITTQKQLATRFLKVMLDGNVEYGISVKPGKTLINFDVADINNIPQLEASSANQFPYCGNLIDTRTLAISKDRARKQEDLHMCDVMTLELRRNPGQGFLRKSISMFRLQLRTACFDTQHNSPEVVWRAIYHSFIDAAVRMYTYFRSVSIRRKGSSGASPAGDCLVFMRAVVDLIKFGIRTISLNMGDDGPGPRVITWTQIRWLGVQAFGTVLKKKQSKYGNVIRSLEGMAIECRPNSDGEANRLWRVVSEGNGVLKNYRF